MVQKGFLRNSPSPPAITSNMAITAAMSSGPRIETARDFWVPATRA
jgi:hypothetical protein